LVFFGLWEWFWCATMVFVLEGVLAVVVVVD
jgi:hypothetical protein